MNEKPKFHIEKSPDHGSPRSPGTHYRRDSTVSRTASRGQSAVRPCVPRSASRQSLATANVPVSAKAVRSLSWQYPSKRAPRRLSRHRAFWGRHMGERRRRRPTLPKQRARGCVARQPMKVPLLIDHLDQLRSSQMRLELSICVMSRSRCLFTRDG
jgi:hypothetical protein